MGYRLNRLTEPIFIAVSKLLLTEFGIHYRLESCVFCWHDLLKSFGVRPEGTPGANHSRIPLAEVVPLVLIKPGRCEGHDQTGRDPGQNSSAAF